jgi:phage repressor protein C with HTH and peptisase S24 domain
MTHPIQSTKGKFLYTEGALPAEAVVRQPLTHAQVWNALDRLAAQAGLSVSGLAKRAGLDPTTFNKSKRITPDGRARWPSTESIAKALGATGTSLASFVQLTAEGGASDPRAVPLMPADRAAEPDRFDALGAPTGQGWERATLPALDDRRAFALSIAGDAWRPAYRHGDIVVVSPAAAIRPGDRVVVKTRDGALMIADLKHQGGKTVELREVNSEAERSLPTADVLWIARIVWATQ